MSFLQALYPADVLYNWESVACDEFCCSHCFLESLTFVGGATTIPYSDATSQDALHGTVVEVGKDVKEPVQTS